MAKKRKRQPAEEETYEFKPPSFDEREFIHRELRETRATVITVLYGGIIGAVAATIALAGASSVASLIAFLVALGGIGGIATILRFGGVDTSVFERRQWLGQGTWYFFTFLAIWVLLLNSPFSDISRPQIHDITLYASDGAGGVVWLNWTRDRNTGVWGWKASTNDEPNEVLHVGWSVNLSAIVGDNTGLSSVRYSINGDAGPFVDMTKVGSDARYESGMLTLSGGSLLIMIEATDTGGRTAALPGGQSPLVPLAVIP